MLLKQQKLYISDWKLCLNNKSKKYPWSTHQNKGITVLKSQSLSRTNVLQTPLTYICVQIGHTHSRFKQYNI